MNNFNIYTDGACSGNPGKGGWGFVCVDDYNNIMHSAGGAQENTTNQRMEMTAIIEACNWVLNNSNDFFTCTIYTDSAYCCNCYKEKWYEKWRINNWITSSKTKVKNIDLWKQLVLFFEDVRFNLVKVKGHAGLDFNEMADRIATQSIRGDK